MKTILNFCITLMTAAVINAQGYKVGDKATDFKLKNVDGKYVSMSDYPDAKGFVVIFTCNHCPFAKAYQDRIIAIDKEYKSKGYPVIAINPNDPQLVPEDSYDAMIQRSKEKGYTFPYLLDEKQDVYKKYGASKTPHAFLLKKAKDNELVVKYIGAIDDNYEDPASVKQNYLSDAIEAVLANKEPNPDFTKAIGCSIKDNTTAKAQ
jgi:peroxiredoxin